MIDGFDEFWKVFPRRVAKFAARTAWDKALKHDTADAIIAGAKRYAKERIGQDIRFTAHPATWLNQGRWLDEQEPAPMTATDRMEVRRQREEFLESLAEKDRLRREKRMQARH